MHPPSATPRPAWLLLAVAGLAAYVASLWLPWRDDELVLSPGVRGVMAAAGVALLVVVARTPRGRRPVATAVGVLGAAVLAYPSLLAVAATERAGTAGDVLASAWHAIPLTLVQLVPLLASREAVGRRHRRPELVVVGVAVVGAAVTGAALALVSFPLTVVSLVLWFGSFAIAPTVTWLAVRGTGGEVRRRALVAALASLVPVVVITACLVLGMLTSSLGTGGAVALLMLGFSAGTLLCGVLSLAAGGPHDAALLGTRGVLLTLHGVLAALGVLVGAVAAVLSTAADLSAGAAVAVGAGAALAAGLPWLWLHGWTRRVVDPAEEVRHGLDSLGRVDGERAALLHVLRRTTGDPALELGYPGTDEGPGHLVVLARDDDGEPTVVGRTAEPAAASRLRGLGDAADLVRPALLEARLEHEAARAQRAAAAERQRLSGDLHDGLQGRLLGLALRLQLGARTLEDPTAVLLAEEAVGALRDAVEDVRALGGGRLPDLLVQQGLPSALRALLRPLDTLVDLELPEERFGAHAEATTYFVVGEAVSNALKHAGAGRIRVRVALDDDAQVRVTVEDDGCGGADPRLGSGLRGLAERVGAAGGSLVVRDASGAPGTTVEATLPCGS